MDFKLIGAILLVSGTSIGAGMLALPIATAHIGFVGSVILLVACWLIMLISAYLILEVNLKLPQNANLISMAGMTTGLIGQVIAWLVYLLLLYALLCAYVGGGSDLLQSFAAARGLHLSIDFVIILFTLVFGLVVFLGIRSVDYVNRGLMLIKFSAYFILVFLLIPHIEHAKLIRTDWQGMTSSTALLITITSFGFSPIIPSLRVYFESDVKKLKKVIFFGSLIPLLCYIAWDAVTMGVVPLEGKYGLGGMLASHNQTSDLVRSLLFEGHSPQIKLFVKLFTSVCLLTSFLGVSLCLMDFLADGLNREKTTNNKLLITALMYVPTALIVIFFPDLFIRALEYSGITSVILLIILPAWMAWRGRIKLPEREHQFTVFGGKLLLLFLILFSIALLSWRFFEHM